MAFASPVRADDPHNIDITVSITAAKSLSVNATYYDFSAMAVNTSSVSVSSITVTNNFGALIETYTLQGANAASTGGGNTWTLAASPAANTYALAGQFSNAQPNNADGDWTDDSLTTSAIPASTTDLGNGVAGESGAGVVPGGVRGLWFRMKTPTSVADTTEHKATLVLAVQ